MSEKNDVVNNIRMQLKGAHDWLEGTLMGVDDALANDVPPGGKVATIGANYAHVTTAEDYFINAMLKGGAPLMMGMNPGISEPPPFGGWGEWGHNVKTDIAAQRIYAQKVYESADAYLTTLSDAALGKEIETPVGKMPLGQFMGLLILNAHCHAGEISTLKGLKGLQGYPG
ncbi:MAG: DinB family protein [Anaerolineae bacterium]|nr:DinB family protein [Anaerolineae bacterium]